jgi:hypothetical protein
LKAKNNETGDQTTTWVYGTTLSDSDVARNDLLRAKEFPDKSGPSDRVEYTPDNTVLTLNYGSANAVDDVLNRLKQLRFGSTVLVDYSYLGQGVPVIANYSSQPGVDEDYDPTGNWRGTSTAYLPKENGSTTLNQNRAHNVVDGITDIITNSGTAWPVPTHDEAGNMKKVPRPLSLGNSFDLKW